LPEPHDNPRQTPENAPPPQRRFFQGWFFWLLIGLTVFVFYQMMESSFEKADAVDYYAFYEAIDDGHVKKITIRGDYWEAARREPDAGQGYWKPGADFKIIRLKIPYSPDSKRAAKLYDLLDEKNEEIAVWNESEKVKKNDKLRKEPILQFNETATDRMWGTILGFMPYLLIFGLLYFFLFRHMRGSGGQGILSFGKSRARLTHGEHAKVTFEDVAGVDEAKEEVQEIVAFLKDPDRFRRLGGRLPRGVLLVGSPGTGKTLLAKAIAGESDTPFFSISGSDFVEMFVGVGASRVRDLFQQAKTHSPCIIFLDEIDAVGRRRGTGLGGGHDEREQTLNAILVEMDGFESDQAVIVIAATNRPDVLDPALLRPGRFDRQIVVDLPDIRGREGILKVHAKKIKLRSEADLKTIARSTPTFSGADLENLINEAAILGTMRDHEAVTLGDMEEARDRVMFGRERRSKKIDDSERKIIAFHEAGHAIVAHLLPESEPLHKVGIIPRGMALGSTMHLPEKDTYMFGRRKAIAEITTLMAGRVSEQLFCDDIHSGAVSDLKRATGIARRMVCQWGMSDELGPVVYQDAEEHLFLGREVARTKQVSGEISQKIDKEIRRIIDESTEQARAILSEHAEQVKAVVDELLIREVLTADEVDRIMRGERLSEPPELETPKSAEPEPGPAPEEPAEEKPGADDAEPEQVGAAEDDEPAVS
jgi:cell division protease FtsH